MKLLLLAALAALALPLAHADNTTVYLVTEYGNLFALRPPPPPLLPGFDTSPYLERHKPEGMLAMAFPASGTNPAIYRTQDIGSRVLLPPQRGAITIVTEESWKNGRTINLPQTPLAGNVRITPNHLQFGLMAHDLGGSFTNLIGTSGCLTGLTCMYADNLGIIQSFTSGVTDTNSRTYLRISSGMTYIEANLPNVYADLAINIACDDENCPDLKAYIGNGNIGAITSPTTHTANAGGVNSYQHIHHLTPATNPSSPTLAINPNIQDVAAGGSVRLNDHLRIQVDIISATSHNGNCHFNLGDPSGRLQTTFWKIGNDLRIIAKFTDASCGGMGTYTYTVTPIAVSMNDWVKLHQGYTLREGDGQRSTRDLIVIYNPGYAGVKLQLMASLAAPDPCCPGFSNELIVSGASQAIVYNADSHLLLLGNGVTLNASEVDELRHIHYIQWANRHGATSTANTFGAYDIVHDSNTANPAYNGLNFCAFDPHSCTAPDQQPPLKIRIPGAGSTALYFGSDSKGEIFDVRNGVRLLRDTAPRHDIMPKALFDEASAIRDEIVSPTGDIKKYLSHNWKQWDVDVNHVFHVLSPGISHVSYSYIDINPHSRFNYFEVDVESGVLAIQDVYAVVPFQEPELVRDLYLSKYPCRTMTDNELTEYFTWVDVHPDNNFGAGFPWDFVLSDIFGSFGPREHSPEHTSQVLKDAFTARAKTYLPYLEGAYASGSTMNVPIIPNRPYLCLLIGNNPFYTTINLYDLRFAGGGFSVGGINTQVTTTTITGTINYNPGNRDLIGDGRFKPNGDLVRYPISETSWETIYETAIQAPRDGHVGIDIISNIGMSWSGLAMAHRPAAVNDAVWTDGVSHVANQWRNGSVYGEFRGLLEHDGTQTTFDLGSVILNMTTPENVGFDSPDPTHQLCAYKFSAESAASTVYADISKNIPLKAGEAVSLKLQARAWVENNTSSTRYISNNFVTNPVFCGLFGYDYVERMLTQINIGTFRVDIS